MTANGTTRRGERRGFTLMEIVIVMGIIILIASIAIPSISAMFTAGSDVQAYNLLAGQLAAARAGAVLDGTYWAVHTQMRIADSGDLTKDSCFSAVMKLKLDRGLATGGGSGSLVDGDRTGDELWDNNEWIGAIVEITGGTGSGQWAVVAGSGTNSLTLDNSRKYWPTSPDGTSAYRIYRFTLADGYAPTRVPGTMAFGKLTDYYVTGGNYQNLTDANLRDFTSLTIIFSPRGEVVSKIYNKFLAPFSSGDPLFSGTTKVWDLPDYEDGVSAVTMFDYGKLSAMNNSARATYLNEYGQFLPVNTYTGRLFPRK